MLRDRTICLLLILAVVGVYWPVHAFDFVQLDDYQYVRDNPDVRDGLTRHNVVHAMTGITQGNWHPLTMLSHMVDCQLFGLAPGWHHLVNLFLHVVNTLLVFRVFRAMTSALWRSALVAALFGLHPQHVESVAWISERKDLLSAFFFLLMLLAYYSYARRQGLLRYVPVFMLLLLGLLAKPMLVTAPFVLLLLDFWPLARWRLPATADQPGLKLFNDDLNEADDVNDLGDAPGEIDELHLEQPPMPERSLGALIAEKLPLMAVSLIFSVITYHTQQASGAMGMLGDRAAWPNNLYNALTSYGSYLSKTVYPSPLAVTYPYGPKWVDALIVGAALLAMLFASLRMARQWPYLIIGLLWFLGMLVPVIGIVQIGTQSMADRYTYLPLIGIFVIIAWGGSEFAAPWPAGQRAAAALVMLAVLAIVSFLQVEQWRDSETLFRHATIVPHNYEAHDWLGQALWKRDSLEAATDEFNEALKIARSEPTFRNLGIVLGIRGKYIEARDALAEAIKAQSNQPEPYRHLAWLLATAPEPSFRHGKEAVKLAELGQARDKTGDPLYGDALAAALAETGQFSKAAATAQAAADAAKSRGEPELAAEILARCQLYRTGKAYHESLRRPLRI